MAVRGVDHHQVHARVHQRKAALVPVVAHGRCGGDPQAALVILAGERVQDRPFAVLQRQKAGQVAALVGDQQLFDPARLHQAQRLGPVGGLAQHGEVVGGHHRADGGRVVAGETHVAVGDDAQDPALVVHHRKAGDVVAVLQRLRIGERLVGAQGDGVVDDPAFKPLDAAHLVRLRLGGQVAVDHADPARLRHGDRHPAFRHRVHRGTDQRDVERDPCRQARRHVGGRRQHAGRGRHEKDVVEGQRLANLHGNRSCQSFVWQVPLSRIRREVQRTGARPAAPHLRPCHTRALRARHDRAGKKIPTLRHVCFTFVCAPQSA